MKVLVTGSTGKTGAPLVAALRARGVTVAAASRDPEDDQVRFDWHDPADHAAALHGVQRVYLVAPVGAADPEPVVRPFLKHARETGVTRVVLLSSSAISDGDPGLGRVDRAVRETIPEFEILRPSWFMQNFVGDSRIARSIRTSGEFVTAAGDGRVGFVDAADIAASAAALLLADQPENTDHGITGPQAISYTEAASIISEITGTAVRHVSVDTQALAALDDDIRRGSQDRATDTVHRLTGREPKSFRHFISGHWDAHR